MNRGRNHISKQRRKGRNDSIGILTTLFTTSHAALTILSGTVIEPPPSPPSIEASTPGPTIAKAELIPDPPPKPKPKAPEPTWELYEVTAYTSYEESTGKTPDHLAFGITASGNPVQAGRTIACPRELAFNTRVDIEGVGVRVCEDRGGKITSGHIDVYIPSLEEAREFGRKRLRVRILKEAE